MTGGELKTSLRLEHAYSILISAYVIDSSSTSLEEYSIEAVKNFESVQNTAEIEHAVCSQAIWLRSSMVVTAIHIHKKVMYNYCIGYLSKSGSTVACM